MDLHTILHFEAIKTGLGHNLNVVVHPGFTGANYNNAAIFDMDKLGIKTYNGGSYDVGEMHVWRGIGGNGLQENDATKLKYAYAAQQGAHLVDPMAHAWIFGLENDDTTLNGRMRTVGTQTPQTE